MAEIIDIINEPWEGHTKGEVETALKSKLSEIGNADTFNVGLTIVPPSALAKDTNVQVSVKGISNVLHPGGTTEDISETLIIEIQTRTSVEGNWISRPNSNVQSNQETAKLIDISPYLTSGENYVRFRAVGDNGNSMWYAYTIQVVNLRLYINTALEVPLKNEFSLNYLIGGAVAKTLYIEIGTGRGTQFSADFSTSIALGTYVNLTTGRNITFDNAPAAIMTEGIHTVRAYLQADEDANVKTDVLESQYMVVDSQGSGEDMVIINDAVSEIDNYTDVTFFRYAVHTDNDELPIVFKLKDATSGVVLSSWEFVAINNVSYSFNTDLALELEDEVQYAYMYIEDTEGNQLSDRIFITVNNQSSYAPVKGAEFILSPANRSNDEANPKTIINAATNTLVNSVWDGFDAVSDGYMAVNKNVEDTSQNAEKVRALHIPANRKLTIGYNPLREFINSSHSSTGLTAKNMTFEIDFRAYNVLDEDEFILKLGTINNIDGKIQGFAMKPLEAYVLTENSRIVDDQNVSWSEGERTRLTINILYGLNPDSDPTRQNNYNFVRIFINDKIEREFFYTANDSFLAEDTQLVIGATGSDIDIFGIRCYQKALSTNEVMQDYVSGLSSNAEKIQWQSKNNILGDDDTISFTKAQAAGYNVLGHTGHLPKYGDQNKGKTKNVQLYIGIAREPKRSGTLTGLEGSGQGTTAMTYYDWNQQYKVGDTTTWIPDAEPEEGDEGKYDFGTNGYAIEDGEAFAKKLVGKINFASSQQGHKLGLTWAFTDVYKDLVNRRIISEPGQMTLQSNARISVYEKPFLFFHRETESDPWTFKYLMTFGAGKGDKPTFGFDKKTTPNMMMVEGADNDVPLALFSIPWDDNVTYNPNDEAWVYANRKNINFGFGKTVEVDGAEYPDNNAGLASIKAFFNFVYKHNVSIIRYYDGTLEQLRNNVARPQQGVDGNAEPSRSNLYWVTDSANRYELYRYDNTSGWIPAGENGTSFNVRTVYEEYCADLDKSPTTWTVGQWGVIAEVIKEQFIAHFRQTAPDYIHVDDALYHSCFVKLFAATDNRAKNTYYYSDPVTLKIRFMQDDLDTVIKTNNVGQNRKPYYVEEHDKSETGAYYWQGENNGFYNLIEDAFSSEFTAMMKNVLTSMASIGGSAMQFMVNYILYAQDYFPATAFNEMTRVVYEIAAVAQNDGIYVNNNARAITQANGSQRWSEYQWLKDRVMYISSWCEFGEFAGSSDASGALGFRGAGATAGHSNVYSFTLTPAKWLYPRISQGESNLDASPSARRVRVQAGQSFSYNPFSLESDSAVAIKGINYYLEIGDMNVPLSTDQTSFTFNGRKLQRIVVNSTGEDTNNFITQDITIGNATYIKEFIVRGVNTLNGAVDLSKCTRLEKIDMRGSGGSNVTLPATNSLKKVYYQATLTRLILLDNESLEEVTLEDAGNLTDVQIDQNGIPALGNLFIYNIIQQLFQEDASLSVLKLYNINWVGTGNQASVELMDWMARVDNSVVRGVVDIYEPSLQTNAVTFEVKQRFINQWGNIDDVNNPLYITYAGSATTQVKVSGPNTMRTAGQYQYTFAPSNKYNNDFQGAEWSIQSNAFGITIDSHTGLVTAPAVATYAAELIITLTYHRKDDTDIVTTKPVLIWDRPAEVGDYVFYDGEYSPTDDGTKTVVGRCIYIHPEDRSFRLCGASIVGSYMWGLSARTNDSITLADNPNIEVFNFENEIDEDVLISNVSVYRIEESTIIDEEHGDADGYVIYSMTELFGNLGKHTLKEDAGELKIGDVVPVGKYLTAKIIEHRNVILNDSAVNLTIPKATSSKTETEHLQELINAMRATDIRNGQCYYYPVASYAYAYIPTIKNNEVLNPKFGLHKWWLASSGEAARIYWEIGRLQPTIELMREYTGHTSSVKLNAEITQGPVSRVLTISNVDITPAGHNRENLANILLCCQF